MPRPRKLDDTKRNEICALVTAGMQLHKVARYVGCSTKTIRRERQANADFDRRVRRAEMVAEVSPLEAMRRAAATHWRAAAWMIERQDRQEEARQQAASEKVRRRDWHLGRTEFCAMADRLLAVVREEAEDPLVQMRLEQRLERVLSDTIEGRAPSDEKSRDRPKLPPGAVAASIATLDDRRAAHNHSLSRADLFGQLAELLDPLETENDPTSGFVPSTIEGLPKPAEFCPPPLMNVPIKQVPSADPCGQNSRSFDP